MVKFTVKKMQPQTVGEILRKTREEANFDLDEICQKLKINKKYLKALEEGDYKTLPIGLYSEKFLKNYADYLNLEFEPLWKLYKKEQNFWYKHKQEVKKFIKIVSPYSLLDVSKIIKICIGGIITAALLGYLGLEIRKIFLPPYLEVINPIDNLITSQSTIEVIGRTEKETLIRINGQEITSSQDGSFSEKINLQEGLNIIKISAKKRHGQENVIYRRVMTTTINN